MRMGQSVFAEHLVRLEVKKSSAEDRSSGRRMRREVKGSCAETETLSTWWGGESELELASWEGEGSSVGSSEQTSYL